MYWSGNGGAQGDGAEDCCSRECGDFCGGGSWSFLARTLCDPSRAGMAEPVGDELVGAGTLAPGGPCWRGVMEVVDLGFGKDSSTGVWERAIASASCWDLVVYTDGSMGEDGVVVGGWSCSRGGQGSVSVGKVATVWDGEVAGTRVALESVADVSILVVVDSTAATSAVVAAARCGRVRTRDLVVVVDTDGRCIDGELRMRLAWVKSHVVVVGNELAGETAQVGYRGADPPQVTEV